MKLLKPKPTGKQILSIATLEPSTNRPRYVQLFPSVLFEEGTLLLLYHCMLSLQSVNLYIATASAWTPLMAVHVSCGYPDNFWDQVMGSICWSRKEPTAIHTKWGWSKMATTKCHFNEKSSTNLSWQLFSQCKEIEVIVPTVETWSGDFERVCGLCCFFKDVWPIVKWVAIQGTQISPSLFLISFNSDTTRYFYHRCGEGIP